ncbi:unnamed protein product [Adineta steineri]|uniref:Uncharacterized protein n=1 Tax=Adineta steineri TaxID=433720 RepID=A0A815I539_9BILA|nr:unnamed protein product [Adineta steineri]CAF1601019.1 unnamed protein product [Adineta steineri]
MPMRQWDIIFCNQDNLNKYSLNQFTLHAQGKIEIDYKQQKSLTIPNTWTTQHIPSAYEHLSTRVLLSDIETTFLPVRIQKFIYSSKTKTEMNQSTHIEVRGNYHDNICGIGQEEIYSLDLLTFPMDNKIEEPIFTFESIVIQQVQGVQSGRWSMEKTIYDKLNLTTDLPNTDHKPYLDTIIKDYLTWHSTHLRLIQLIERFPHLKPFLIILNKYGSHLKDILSGEKNGLDIFVGDEEIGEIFQQVKFLLSATKTQQISHTICQHLQLQYERQTKDDNSFENYRLRIFWLTDSDCSDVLSILDLLLNLSQQTDLTNSLIDLRRLLVPNGLLLLLELVHIPLYFDLIFCFNDEWWSSSDDNNRALKNIQQWTTLVEQIEGSNIIESTINQNESTLIISQKTTSNEILQRLDERINQTWLIFTKDDNNSFGHILSSLLLCSNIEMFDIRHSTLDPICSVIPVLLTTYKQVSIIFAWQLDQVALNENNDELAFKQNEELISGTLARILQTIQKPSPHFYPFVYVLTDHAQFNNDSNLSIIPSPFIDLARSLISEYERHRLQLIDL